MTKSSSAKSQIAGEEAVKMLSHDNVYVGGTDCTTNHSLADRVRSTSSPRRIPLFESTSSKWWNPQFVSTNLETQYWKISFPLLRDRFRLGLIYIMLTSTLWMTYLRIFQQDSLMNWLVFTGLILLCIGMLHFACNSDHYQRFYLPTSFLSSFLIYIITLLIFSQHTGSFMGPMATLTTSTQVILLVYTVIPLPLYVCIIFNILYSFLFELITIQNQSFGFVEVPSYIRMAAHFCVHCLGIHLYILTQIRQRKTFLTVGLSLLIHDDLNRETKFKNNMILSVMPENMAEDLVKDAGELRRPSQSADSAYRMSNATTVRSSAGEGVPGSVNPSFGQVNDVRKFRPFTMNLMDEVTIVFADVAGFTKMSSNKSADELVSLLNDLFGRFDYLCSKLGCEKISTLGDCYYSVCGCPIPNKNHANKCIELGLAMIIAIRQFDIDRKQEVNMRIGVHSGKVMCGMVGTKRFKFDVFSNDVTLANEMESTGIAGRVHISETTAKFLDTRYKLDEGPVHQSLKTYFIAGRSKELEDEVAAELKTDSLLGLGPEAGGSITKGAIEPNKSFRRKVHNKMKAIAHSSSTRGSPNSQLGGSFKFRELEQDMQLQTTSNLNVSGDTEVVISSGRRKSSSLMALGKTSFSMSCPEKDQFMDDEDETAVVARRIGGKISMDLAHESSINNSLRGSRSSGLQDLGSEALSVAALDNAISHHHNAASITRYDAECKDTAEKIAQSVKKFNQRQNTKINEVDKILADEESDVPMNCDVPCSSTYGPDRHESLAFPGDWTDGFQTLFFKLEDPLEPEAFCRRNINDTCQLANVVEDYQQNQSTLFHFAYHGGLCHLTQYIQSISDNYNYIVKLGDTIRNQQTKEEAYIGDNAAIDLDDESIISCPPKKKKTMSDHSTYAADESYHKSILEMKDSFNIQSIIQAELFPENVSEIDEGVEMALNIPKETGYNTKSTKNKKESEEKSMASHFANPKTQELFDENVIPLYVIISLNCFLKLSGYAEALIVKNRADAIILLRILLGIGESKISTAEKEKLTVLPFEVLKSIYETTHLDKESENGAVLLRQQSVEEGVCDIIFTILEHYSHQKSRFDLLRTRSMSEVSTDIGIIKYLLSLNTHFDSFKAKEKIKNARQMPKNLNDYNQALLPYNAPGIGKPNETYWAKGTGFGHGVTSQHWNMNAHINKQKNDEKTVSIMLDIISAFILIKSESTENDRIRSRASSRIGHRSRQNTNTSTNTMNADESGSLNRSRYSISEKSDINDSIMDIPNQIKKDNKYFISLEFVILTFRSSLSEIIKTYLINDSVMDIVKHVAVYESLFKVMLAMAHCEPFSGQYTEVVNPEELGLLKEEHFKSKHLDLIPALINFDNNGTKTFQNFKGIYENVGNYLRQIQKVQCSVSKDVPPQNEYDEEIVKITKKSVECEDDVENNENGLAYLLSQMDILYNLIKPKLEEFSEEMEIDDEVENKSETIEDIYVRTMKSIQFVQMPFKNERDTFIVPYYYANQIASTESGLGSRKRTKRLAQEMITLANSLPLSFGSSIFVRTCEERFDIIKVLITGPKDTPYENGCFEFDCFFPVDYPNSPVLCHLNTTGNNTCRMSPNLYADGKVCLSILNTWHGRPEERWNAETSSLLQVLVSIQSLILVNEPYFNEPGYEKSKNTENGRIASRDYQLGIQQNVVRWAILEQIKNPAKGFVDVIQNHFYLKQNEILEQIKKSIAEAESKDNSSELAGKSQILQHIKSLKFYYDRLVLIFKDFKAPNQMKGNVIEDSPFEKPALKPNESVIDTEVVLPTTSEYNDFMNSNMEY